MLKVTIEYIPNGSKKDREILGTIAVVNNLKHPLRPLFGSYDIIAENKKSKHRFTVNHFERHNGYWCLVHNVMRRICELERTGICQRFKVKFGGNK